MTAPRPATFARYNRWANRRLFDAVAKLDEAAYKADRGAFFGSLEGTLNHLLIGDRIWMRRFTGQGPVHTELAAIPYPALDALRTAREGEDERIVAYADTLSDADLDRTFVYSTLTAGEVSQRLGDALDHFFNHQTHHRGQAHTLVTMAAGNDVMPQLDLLYYQREVAAA